MSYTKRLPLPDPQLLKNIDPELRDYLVRVNVEMQKLNQEHRNATSGTLVHDDGNNRVTYVIEDGRFKSVTIAATSGATLTYTVAT